MRGERDEPDLIGWFSILGDPARLRLLRLLEREELGVGELAKVTQLPQSTVSRHLKVLAEAGWVGRRSVGTASLYRLDPRGVGPEAQELWAFTRERLGEGPTFAQDDHRLREVLAERPTDSQAFFGRLGGEWDTLRKELFGRPFTPDALLGLLPQAWTVFDVGCGTGDVSQELAPVVTRVVAIDREPAMLDAAKRRLREFKNVEFREGDLRRLPGKNAEANASVLSLVMHHVREPVDAVRELKRVTTPGGPILIVDMVAHERETYRQTMGHVHLGFERADVEGWAREAGLTLTHFRRLRPDPEAKGPGLFAGVMRG